MSLIRCQECGAQISSSASSCPNCGKKMTPSGCVVFLFIILAIISVMFGMVFFVNEGAKNNHFTSMTHVDSLRYEQNLSDVNTIVVSYLKRGLLVRVEPSLNSAYVNPIKWGLLDIQDKERVSRNLAIYCGTTKGTNLNWVNIVDTRSGKVLALYSQSRGFKIY